MFKKFFLSAVLLLTVIQAEAKTTRVAIMIYDQMNILDFAGPREVFNEAERALKEQDKADSVEVITLGYPTKTITTLEGTKIIADKIFDGAQMNFDILIVPGGSALQAAKDQKVTNWIKKNSNNENVVMSVCTGAFILAEAELLNGKQATTHHSAIDLLQKNYPLIKVVPNLRFIDTGPIVTTAGVSAGIDGALHLVVRYFGIDIAKQAADVMEYDWKFDSARPTK